MYTPVRESIRASLNICSYSAAFFMAMDAMEHTVSKKPISAALKSRPRSLAESSTRPTISLPSRMAATQSMFSRRKSSFSVSHKER